MPALEKNPPLLSTLASQKTIRINLPLHPILSPTNSYSSGSQFADSPSASIQSAQSPLPFQESTISRVTANTEERRTVTNYVKQKFEATGKRIGGAEYKHEVNKMLGDSLLTASSSNAASSNAASHLSIHSRIAAQSLYGTYGTTYGIRDQLGHSDLPSRPGSAADNWGTRKDLLKIAKASEDYMIEAGKLPARHDPPPDPPTPRLTEEQVHEVDRFVQAYEKRTLDRIVFETPSERYRRLLENIKDMSLTQKRAELRARNLHKKNLSESELSQRLAIAYTKETRQKRLEEAHRDCDNKIIQKIRKECNAFHVLTEKPMVLPRKVDKKYYNSPRTVFLNIIQLDRDLKNLTLQKLEPAIFIFDLDREWVFRPAARLPDGHFDSKYVKISDELKEVISFKEDAGLCFWFRPSKSYDKLSDFISRIQDPMDTPDRANYGPLKNQDFWWWRISQHEAWKGLPYYGERRPEPRFVREIPKITSNFKTGGFEMACTAELIAQSNPSLDIAPWFDVPVADDSSSKTSKSRSSLMSKGTVEQRRKLLEKERNEEMKKLQEEEGKLAVDLELGEVATAVTLQSFVRGSLSRGNSRGESREGGGGLGATEEGGEREVEPAGFIVFPM